MISLCNQEEPDGTCLLTSFASLLSFAEIHDGESPLAGSSESLPCFLSPTLPTTELCCSFPSLCIHKQDTISLYGQSSDKLSSLEEAAAFNLAAPFLCAKGSDQLIRAPALILNNVSSSFMYLINSRMKYMMKALMKQGENLKATQSDPDEINTGTQDRINLILRLLAGSNNPIEFQTVVTNFRVVSGDEEGASKSNSDGALELVLPLIFEVFIEAQVLGTIVSNFSIQVPGTITGSFNETKDMNGQEVKSDGLLTAVLVAFDTHSLLSSMMKHARVLVKTAASAATALAASSETPEFTQSGVDVRKINQSHSLAHRKYFGHKRNQHQYSVNAEVSSPSDYFNTHNSLSSCCSDGDSSYGLSNDNLLSISSDKVNSSIASPRNPLNRGYYSTDHVRNLARIRKVNDVRSSVLRKLKQSTEDTPSSFPVTSRRVSFGFDNNVTPTGQIPVAPSQNASWMPKNRSGLLKKDLLKDASTAAIGLTLLRRPANKRDRDASMPSTSPLNGIKSEVVDVESPRDVDYISPQLPLRKRRIKSCPGFLT